MRIGPALADDTTMGPLVDHGQLQQNLAYIAGAAAEGARLVTGGRPLTTDFFARGHFLEPTIFDGVRPEMTIAREEVFGPVLSILEVENLEEAIRITNAVDYGLTASVYSRDLVAVQRFIDGADVGMVHVNSPTVGGEAHVPFGGLKASGVGDREMASEGVRFFTETKTVFLDYTGQRRAGSSY